MKLQKYSFFSIFIFLIFFTENDPFEDIALANRSEVVSRYSDDSITDMRAGNKKALWAGRRSNSHDDMRTNVEISQTGKAAPPSFTKPCNKTKAAVLKNGGDSSKKDAVKGTIHTFKSFS